MRQTALLSHIPLKRHSDKETPVNNDTQEQPASVPCVAASSPETEQELLAGWGFTAAEITSLLWLRQWYQTAGSVRKLVVRHLEFLRLLVRSGELEL